MSCPQVRPAPLRCPTLVESMQATCALLPRGRAWPANDGGGLLARFLAWLGALSAAPTPNLWPQGYVQTAVLAAIGAVRNYLEQRLCDLRLEFWCATHRETHDLWMAEYGLPDPCDPFPDLCVKVAALGGARCEYFNAIVARAGWVIDCVDDTARCGSMAGCARAGTARAGRRRANFLRLIVDLAESVSFTGHIQTPPRAGRFRAGRPLVCPPNIDSLRCLVDRIAPAHVQISYETV